MNAARFSPFLLAALLLGSSAHAQPSDADKRNASALTLEGQRLLKGGDASAALAKFQAAHDILHAPTTGLDVAMAYEALGQLVEARAMVYEVSRLPILPKEPFSFTQARSNVAAIIEALDSRIPSVVLRIEGAPKETVTVTVDGQKIPPESVTAPFSCNPGKREVVVTAPGYRAARATVELVEGVIKPVEVPIALEREVIPVKAPPPPPPPPPRKEESAPARSNVLFYTGIAVSGALAAVAVGTGIGAAVAEQKSEDDWSQANCNTRPTPSSCYTNFNEQERQRFLLGNTAVWTAIGAAVIGGGTLTYALLTRAPTDEQPQEALWVSPTVGGVVIRGTF